VRTSGKARTPFGWRLSRSISLGAAACLAFFFVACGGNNKTPAANGPAHTQSQSSPKKSSSGGGSGEETSSKTIAGQQVNFKKSADVSGKSSVEIEADNFYFSPTVLKGKPGQSITVELKNEGTVTHNFTLPSNHISKDLSVGQKAKVKITFPKSGTVLFHCAFHQFSGMRGALESS
jgi:plastocyanin